ncbi:CHAT domain-containing protein [Flavobacterium sp. 9AF]|uniref:CHAT domain-containing protein n=1 Tax=Flavobacterium sp. 9AF TaxID=2653142 RepID=UPI0012F0AFE4|nr:CHAT domain-containing protein [Flavobacterium sp. 9AF]VXB27676.1 CHAT domain-containing protein [Flavobacterium sp. 9AF]
MIRGNSMQFGNFKSLLLLFFSISSLSQNLEDKIYTAIDIFVAYPNKKELQILNEKEFQFSKSVITNDEKLALVILYCNKGSYEMKNNFQQEAITSYEKAWQLFSENNLSNYDIIEYCLKPLGTLYTKNGNFTLAENIIKKYLFLAEKNQDQTTIISGYINLSIVYKTIGKHTIAIELLQKIAQNPNVTNLQKNRIEEELTMNTIGLQKIQKNKILENESFISKSPKTNAFVALQKGQHNLALSYLNQAKQEVIKNKSLEARELAQLYVHEANIYFLLNQTEKSKDFYIKAIQILLPIEKNIHAVDPNSLYPETTFLLIFDGLALLEKDINKQLQWYELSFHVSDLLFNNIITQEAQIIHQTENRIRTEKCLNILWKAYQKSKAIRFLEKAFEYAERSKNRALKERKLQKNLLDTFPDNKNLQLQNDLLVKQESLINDFIRLQITQENQEKLITINDELTTLTITLKNLTKNINQEFKKNEQKQIFNWAFFEQKLKKDQAQLAYYFWSHETLYLFYFNDNQKSWHKIDIKNHNELIKKYIHYFDNAHAINEDISNFITTSHSLYKNIGLNSIEKNKNLIIIPDGLLHFVSFDALITKKTNTTLYAEIPFLVYQNKIAYETNASFYCENYALKKKGSIVGFFPIFKNTNAYLAYSLEEAKALKENNAILFMNEMANRENFKKNIGLYNIIHLSTHGTSGSFNTPSTLVLYDDLLLVNELYGLNNCHPDLVVLSACETGIGKIQKGEGAVSIARAFQYAGAKNVLFSLWKINDYATSELMTNFYTHYNKKHSFFESNYLSKIDYLENKTISNTKKSPYYWSAFVYYGAIDNPETNYIYHYVLGFLLLIVLFLSYGRIARFLKRKEI